MNAVVAESPLTEREKYQLMWSHDQYRQVSPGAAVAHLFLKVATPQKDAKVIDFGCGTGRGGAAIAEMAHAFGNTSLRVDLMDFASNCLDPEVKDACDKYPQFLRFIEQDLTQPIANAAPYGFCTDVMEHIPPEDVDRVLTNILHAAQHVFFQISCTDDACGVLIGHPLHLSVHPPAWWKKKLEDLGCTILFWEASADESYCVAYVTAWATGKDVVDKAVLNVEEEQIRANVRANMTGRRWKQVVPHLPADKEVMIVGGGPSLADHLDTIKRMRAQGALLITLNGAYNWALENGLSVSGTVVVDARPHNARFTKPVVDGCHYLIGSQVDPSVLEGLPEDRTYLWHTTAEVIKDILEELSPDDQNGNPTWFGIPGGSTVLLRAIPMLRMLGYKRFHLFGCDSCVMTEEGSTVLTRGDTYQHHAYVQHENDGVPLFPVTLGGRVFMCQGWHIGQGEDFINLVRYMGNLFEIEVHGDGLLAWILKHGANLDIEREEAEEAAEEARMK